jgi:phosphotransferase system  glucose/maltose/N-acetylglucosamine-specific IIC component
MKGVTADVISDDDVSLSSGSALLPMNLERDSNVSRTSTLRMVVAGILIACVIFVLVDSFTTKRIESAALAFFAWVEANPFLGVLSVVLVYIIATSM